MRVCASVDSVLLFGNQKNKADSPSTVLLTTSTLAMRGVFSGENILDCFVSENGVFVVKKEKTEKETEKEKESITIVSKVDFCGVLQSEWELTNG